jgi:hypothetical protein
MLYKKDRSVIKCNSKDLFIYEATCYRTIDRFTICLEDTIFLQSKEFIKEQNVIQGDLVKSLTLISAPMSWIRGMGYEEVDDNYGIKKKFIKNL